MSVNVITIDGPSGVGKGSCSAIIANEIGYHYLDSGSLYRLLALASQRRKLEVTDQKALAKLALQFEISFESLCGSGVKALLDGEDVTKQLRSECIGMRASQLAVHSDVRDALLRRQRSFAAPPGLIADGRDMGTTVFPEANLKFFLTAGFEQRVDRRFKELLERDENVSLRAVRALIEERDRRDKKRKASPLVPAEDAIEIDTSAMSIDEVVHKIVDIAARNGLIKGEFL